MAFAFGVVVATILVFITVVTPAYGQLNGEEKVPAACPFIGPSVPVSKGGGFFQPYWHNFTPDGASEKTYTPAANPTLSDDGEYMWFDAQITLRCFNWVKYGSHGEILYATFDWEKVSGSERGYVVKRSNCTRQNDESKIPLASGSEGQMHTIASSYGERRATMVGEDGACGADGGSGESSIPSGYTYLVCKTVDHYVWNPNTDEVTYLYSEQTCYYTE